MRQSAGREDNNEAYCPEDYEEHQDSNEEHQNLDPEKMQRSRDKRVQMHNQP